MYFLAFEYLRTYRRIRLTFEEWAITWTGVSHEGRHEVRREATSEISQEIRHEFFPEIGHKFRRKDRHAVFLR